jgi:hypothetical protein
MHMMSRKVMTMMPAGDVCTAGSMNTLSTTPVGRGGRALPGGWRIKVQGVIPGQTRGLGSRYRVLDTGF